MSGWFLSPERALAPAEAARLLVHARSTMQAGIAGSRLRDARDGALAVLLLATGLRVSEALGIRMADVTLRRDGGEVRVRLLKKRRLKDGTRPVGVAFFSGVSHVTRCRAAGRWGTELPTEARRQPCSAPLPS